MTSQSTTLASARGGETEDGSSVRRPGTLLAAIGVATVAALATVGNGIVMTTGGEKLALEILASALGEDATAVRSMGGGYIAAEMVETLNARGMLALIFGGGLLLFALLMARAAIWTRVLVTIFAAITILIGGLVASDDGTGLIVGLGILGVVGAVLTFVFVWLPANNRYAKELKQLNKAR